MVGHKPLIFFFLEGFIWGLRAIHPFTSKESQVGSQGVTCQINPIDLSFTKFLKFILTLKPQIRNPEWKIKNGKRIRSEGNVCFRLGGISNSERI